jgi:hypothetical protein
MAIAHDVQAVSTINKAGVGTIPLSAIFRATIINRIASFVSRFAFKHLNVTCASVVPKVTPVANVHGITTASIEVPDKTMGSCKITPATTTTTTAEPRVIHPIDTVILNKCVNVWAVSLD